MSRTRNCSGFTLFDLLIVALILGILGAVTIPHFKGLITETKLNEAAGELVTGLQYDIAKGSFKEGWSKAMPRIREKKAGALYSCTQCTKMPLCGFCPAFFELETGSEDLPSEYLCHMGQLRYQAIRN